MCPSMLMHTWTHLNMNFPTLSKVPGHLRRVRQYQIRFGGMSLHYRIDLDTLGVLSVPGDKNLKDCGPWNVGALTRQPKCLGANLDINIFSSFILGTSLLKFDQAC
jgi:peptidoglycan/xylan/chitin deacetylase (PgdA/CDA1 family)